MNSALRLTVSSLDSVAQSEATMKLALCATTSLRTDSINPSVTFHASVQVESVGSR